MKVDMSPQAVTNRMKMLDQLWELAIALRSSKIVVDTKPKIKRSKELPGRVSDKTAYPTSGR